MEPDYSKGRYKVVDSSGKIIGRIDDDEYVRCGAELLYRIDGAEVYAVNGGLVAFISGGVATTSVGQKLFTIGKE